MLSTQNIITQELSIIELEKELGQNLLPSCKNRHHSIPFKLGHRRLYVTITYRDRGYCFELSTKKPYPLNTNIYQKFSWIYSVEEKQWKLQNFGKFPNFLFSQNICNSLKITGIFEKILSPKIFWNFLDISLTQAQDYLVLTCMNLSLKKFQKILRLGAHLHNIEFDSWSIGPLPELLPSETLDSKFIPKSARNLHFSDCYPRGGGNYRNMVINTIKIILSSTHFLKDSVVLFTLEGYIPNLEPEFSHPCILISQEQIEYLQLYFKDSTF